MGSHSYLVNLNSCAGLPASVRKHMQCGHQLQELGDAYVKNFQAQGTTNFRNTYGHGNTQVDNLAGLPGSVQNFGLQELLLGANGHGIWQHDPTLQTLMIGPAWTYNDAVPKPIGTKDMGSWTAMQYTKDQLNDAKMSNLMLGSTMKDLYTYEKNFNAGN